jgi:hypothetical protein
MCTGRVSVSALLFVSWTTACGQPTAPDAPPVSLALQSPGGPPPSREWVSTDEFFLRVHDAVPGFAGFRLDDGVPTVHLVHSDRAEQARFVLTPLLVDRGWDDRGFQARGARYSWAELYDWRVRALTLLSMDEMRSLSISVPRNRLVLGVAQGVGPDRVASRIADLGIPNEAVEIEDADFAATFANLSDRLRPVMGGYEITSYSEPDRECTAGFNVLWEDTLRTMLTAAHCVGPVGSVSPRTMWQPEYTTDNRIGVESLDPAFFACPEASGQPVCRNSDAALVLHDDSVSWSFGHIARTTGSGHSSGSTSIGPSQSRFWIVDSYYGAVVGDTLHKIGRTTGWTTGEVTDTCVHRSATHPSTGQYWLLCQDVVDAGAGGGDSGAPVFRMGVNGQVRLAGVLWGDASPGFYYSSMSQIEMDFGAYLDVITNAPTLPSGLSITGPTEVEPGATCSWQGNVTGGTTPFSYSWTIDGGQTVSTTDNFTGGKPPESLLSSFVLRFTVTNDAGSEYAEITVTEDQNAEICLI